MKAHLLNPLEAVIRVVGALQCELADVLVHVLHVIVHATGIGLLENVLDPVDLRLRRAVDLLAQRLVDDVPQMQLILQLLYI